MSTNHKIKTPHAAVIVWNYDDRISQPEGPGTSASGTTPGDIDRVRETVISTVSCVSIQTSKSKSQPDGEFSFVLAPYKNWVAALTPGSWCVILMSNDPITPEDLKTANRKKVKMIGKIETIRVQTEQGADGSRRTLYYVSGVDWGHVMNNIIYVDNYLAGPNDPKNQGNPASTAIRKMLVGNGSTPQSFLVYDNLAQLLDIFGKPVSGFDQKAKKINSLGGTRIYNLNIPKKMVDYFKFKKTTQSYDKKKKISTNTVTSAVKNDNKGNKLNDMISLITGYLNGYDNYTPSNEALGYIDPFSLQGTNSFWQILLENSNPALNEMLCEMRWLDDTSLALAVYNRIKPFSYKGYSDASSKAGIKSFFQNLRTHELENDTVISINAGTNWRDKYNFIEIKPSLADFKIYQQWIKQKSQVADELAFDREGFRPLIVGTKQFPYKGSGGKLDIDMDKIRDWCFLLREWFFDTHRLLNGTIVLTGINEYIAVGDNIRLDAKLINPTPNMNRAMTQSAEAFLLAHVENISHSFAVDEDGARQYRTTIQFVRGIITNSEKVKIGDAAVDKYSAPKEYSDGEDKNTANILTSPTEKDPGKIIKDTE